MGTFNCRPPTEKEAVEWILASITPEYIRAQLAEWRQLYGDEFADRVRSKARAAWKTKKR